MHRPLGRRAQRGEFDQWAELDRRLDAYKLDGNAGRRAEVALVDIRKRL